MTAHELLQERGLAAAWAILARAPQDAEYYHSSNDEYVKDISQEHLAAAEREPDKSHLVGFMSSDCGAFQQVSETCNWDQNSAWIEYIQWLTPLADLRNAVAEVSQ